METQESGGQVQVEGRLAERVGGGGQFATRLSRYREGRSLGERRVREWSHYAQGHGEGISML